MRFLDRLGTSEGTAQLDIGALRALSGMIGEETLFALRAAQDATLRAEAATRDLGDLEEALARARQALAALETGQTPRAALSVGVSADAATQALVRVSYVSDAASWTPVYDLRLSRPDGVLDLVRGAFVAQSTGEDWRDVALTLSTVRPSGQMTPSVLDPQALRIFEEDALPRPLAQQRSADMARSDAPMIEEAMRVNAVAQYDGINVSYAYPAPVTIATGADRVRLSLDTITFQTDLRARAVPRHDDTAFLMAGFDNDTLDPILPSDAASFYLDGRYVGRRGLDLVPAGGAADLSFGPIEGIRLSRRVLDRTGGDRGVLSRSNEMREEIRVQVENLTDTAWPVELIDSVPYSEQEDLKIDWRATPAPTQERVEDQRGLLAWRFDLGPGATQDISLSTTITWPDGWVLR